MTFWRIDPAGVITTLNGVQTAATDLARALDPVAPTLDDLIAGCDQIGSVASAVQSLLETDLVHLRSASDRIAAGILGAGAATASYVEGDQAMATANQAAAVAASESGDLSFFGVTSD